MKDIMKTLTTATAGTLSIEGVSDIDTIQTIATAGTNIVSGLDANTIEASMKIITQIIILVITLVTLLNKRKEKISETK